MAERDPLLEKIDAIIGGQRAHDRATSQAHAESRVERMHHDAGVTRRFFFQLGVAAAWMWHYVLKPIWRALLTTSGFVFRQYRKLWSLTVYYRNEFGTLYLSKTRAGLFLTGTAAALWCAAGLAGFFYDVTLYGITGKHDEVFYLTSSQEIDAGRDVHAVKGCAELPCSDADSMYFRMNPSWFNHLWSLSHNHMLFYPDFVAAAVPPGLNRCIITTYGIRFKVIMRGFDLYPELLKASCVPVAKTIDEVRPGTLQKQ